MIVVVRSNTINNRNATDTDDNNNNNKPLLQVVELLDHHPLQLLGPLRQLLLDLVV